MLKINVPILGKRPGDTISEGDKDYDTFAAWAKKQDRRGGMVICAPFKEEEVLVDDAPEGDKSDGEAKESEDDGASIQGAEDADVESEDAPVSTDVEGADASGTVAGDTVVDNTPPVADKPKGNKGDQKKPKKPKK